MGVGGGASTELIPADAEGQDRGARAALYPCYLEGVGRSELASSLLAEIEKGESSTAPSGGGGQGSRARGFFWTLK